MAAAFFGWSPGGCWSRSQGQSGFVLLVAVSGKLAPTVSREGHGAVGAKAVLAPPLHPLFPFFPDNGPSSTEGTKTPLP